MVSFLNAEETANSGDKKDEAAKEEAKAEELTTSAKEDKWRPLFQRGNHMVGTVSFQGLWSSFLVKMLSLCFAFTDLFFTFKYALLCGWLYGWFQMISDLQFLAVTSFCGNLFYVYCQDYLFYNIAKDFHLNRLLLLHSCDLYTQKSDNANYKSFYLLITMWSHLYNSLCISSRF